MGERKRDEGGQYVETVTPENVLEAFEQNDDPCEPFTAREIADSLGCDRKTAYNKLRELAESERLNTKKVGARGRVWWRSENTDR